MKAVNLVCAIICCIGIQVHFLGSPFWFFYNVVVAAINFHLFFKSLEASK